MKINRFRQILLCLSAAVIFIFSFSGCEALGIGSGNNSPKPAVYISQSEISLAVGDTVLLSATATDGAAVLWESSNPDVATVSGGLVTGVSEGDAIIMASTSAMATCTIKVTKAPATGGTGETPAAETLVLSLSNLSLEVGNSVTLTATSSTGAAIIWNSTNKTVATVVNGKVTAKAVGKTTITANTGTAMASCEISVTDITSAQKPGYNLVWYDEFNGTSLDASKWSYQLGTRDFYHDYDTGVYDWGNGELQTYTQDSVNVSGGSLVITASKLQQQQDGKNYKSGRILTRDKASWTYGYVEARIKTPTGTGMWPAFWMLPQPTSYADTTNKYGGWPYNGEIDIMEAKGRLLDRVDTTLHFGPLEGSWDSHFISNKNNTGGYKLSSNTDKWHTYAVNWTANYIKWIVDGTEVMSVSCDEWYTRSPAASGSAAPFDQPFYVILNLAVGGKYDNFNEPAATFSSASMYVDYVRVYEQA